VNADLVWQIIIAASALGAVALWLTLWWMVPTRGRFGGIWRWLLVAAALIFFLLPAPVPNFSGAQAPAFVVMIFEAFFQRAGEPEESMRRLLTGGVGLIMLAALWLLLRRFVRR
jgi:hypothetical protein